MSAETCRIFGSSRQARSAAWKPSWRWSTPTIADALQQAAAAALRGEPFDNELRIVIGETTRWITQRAEVEFDEEGKPLRSVGTTQDITEHGSNWKPACANRRSSSD
jgi:PAS domain-containing protein